MTEDGSAYSTSTSELFEGHYDVLYNLYDLVSIGGWVVCDDCGQSIESYLAVKTFRE